MAEFTLICCVVHVGHASGVLKHAKNFGVKGGTFSIGRSITHDRLADILEINEERREIVTMIIEDELADSVINGISKEIEFHKPNHGIMFSYSVKEYVGSKNELVNKLNNNKEKFPMYKIIYAIVEKGRGEDVIDAANKAGVGVGTIINARGAGPHEVQKLFSIEVEPEKEEVFVITRNDMKDAVVDSIKTHLKIEEPGNGILFVIDLNEVYGLHI